MTTIYTPNGQTSPEPDYVLPQDVADLVVVETVNSPFTTSANNIAWLLLMLVNQCSVKNFGAVGDDTANDTAAINAAIAACPFVYVPAGLYRHTGLTVGRSCVLFGVNGSSSLRLDHPTNDYFSMPNGDTVLQLRDVSVRGKQNNSGTVFATSGVNVKVIAERCAINQDHYLLGRLASASLAGVQLNDCDTSSRYTGAAYSLPVAQGGISGGKLEMAPAATFPVIGPVDGASRVQLSDVYFWQISTLGGLAFVDCGIGQIAANGCTFSVDDSGAGSGTFAFRINGAKVNTSGITLIGCSNYQFATKAADGSRLELIPTALLQTADASFTLSNGVETIAVDASNAAPPNTAILPRILFNGQRFTMIMQNGSAGNWSGPFVVAAQFGDGILDAGAGEFSNLPQDKACAVSFVAANYFGDDLWIQSSASVQVPP